MAGYGALVQVDGPVPSPPRFTILTESQVVTETDDHWINGVAVWPYPCGPASRFDQCATSVTPKSTTVTASPQDFGAFTAYLSVQCTSRGIGRPADRDFFKQRAMAAFVAYEAGQVEAEFWDGGTLSGNPHLTSANSGTSPLTILNAGNATNLMNGLSLLEGSLATMHRRGVIHATPALVNGWASQHMIYERDNHLETINGTRIIPGAGYSGNAPAGVAANTGTQQCAFATTDVQIRRSEAFITPDNDAEATDRTLNNVRYYAERYYAIDFDQCLRAVVKIDRNQAAA